MTIIIFDLFQVFDTPSQGDDPFEDRLKSIHALVRNLHTNGNAHIVEVEHKQCTGIAQVDSELARVLGLGGEGLSSYIDFSRKQYFRSYLLPSLSL